jgi:pilus assembly protein Flp/PilA
LAGYLLQLNPRRGVIMAKLWACLAKDETGATAIEYAIIAGTIAIAIVAAVQGIGTTLNNTFTSVSTGLR